MKQYQRTTALMLAASLVAAVAALNSPAAGDDSDDSYRLIDLGSLGGGITMAFAVNAANGVVGVSETLQPIPEMHAIYWSNGELRDLGTLGGAWGEARDINDSNLIVGASETAFGEVHAFYWYDGHMFDLNDVRIEFGIGGDSVGGEVGQGAGTGHGQPPFLTFVEANAINNFGVITGAAQAGDTLRAFILYPGPGSRWDDPNYIYYDLGTLPSTDWSRGTNLNDLNQVVGVSGDHAFVWADGHMEVVGGYSDYLDQSTHAAAITNDAFIAGSVTRTDAEGSKAVIWTPDAYRIDLPTSGEYESVALDMNASGMIVGWIADTRTDSIGEHSANRIAVLWDGWHLLTMLQEVIRFDSLSPVAWEGIEAPTSINNNAWIAGWGRLTNGEIRAFVLEPILDNN